MRQAFRKCVFFFTEERAGAIESLVWKKHMISMQIHQEDKLMFQILTVIFPTQYSQTGHP